MDLTYAEIVRLNIIVGVALLSGKIEFDDISKSLHKKIADEIVKRNSPEDFAEKPKPD